ncbi:MAG: 50S ribosomal protein L13 [Chloroflexi bacterium]|nr:50S ribosomal protein L13 [Chloroflexota bacterium]
MKTYTAKKEDIERQWFVIDAKDQTLGRMATQIATILRGKHKPIFTPHMDTGDFVIVVNAEKIHVTGDRLDQKLYYRHSGYPGGLRSKSLRQMLRDKPEDVIYEAVRRMLPKNNLGRQMLKKLKVYAGPEHPHAAQQPVKLELEN